MQGNFDSNVANSPAVTATGSNGGNGLLAQTDHGTAILASSDKFGIVAGTAGGVAITANATGNGLGVRANTQSGNAVNAQSLDAVAVLGASNSNIGVQGICQAAYNYGVVGIGPNAGVAAFNPNNSNAAYLAADSLAAWFTGNVLVTGRFWKGGGGFRIDHPQDPGNMFLSHSFVESSEMKNFYDGIAETDDRGEAEIELPGWFESLNDHLRYQLCPIAQAMPELHVARILENGCFKIAGAKPRSRVSWQVTGVRRDPWAIDNPLVVEEAKEARDRDHFLHPHLFGKDAEQAIGLARHRPSGPSE